MAKKPKKSQSVTIKDAPKKSEPMVINHDSKYESGFTAWWEVPDDQPNQMMSAAVERVRNAFRSTLPRFQHEIENLNLYNDRRFDHIRDRYYTEYEMSLNVVKSCVTTAQAKIAKIKPKPRYLTSGGNFEQKKRAQDQTKFITGIFDENSFYSQAQQAFAHAAVVKLGAIKIYWCEEEEKIKTRLCDIGSVFTHEAQASTKDPFEIFEVKKMNKYVLIDKYPEHKSAIESAAKDFISPNHRDYQRNQDADEVMVAMIYKKPFQPGEKGRWCKVIEGALLDHGEWNKDYFPYAIFRWRESQTSWFGDPLASEIKSIQLEINQLLRNIQQGHDLVAKPRMFVPKTAQFEKSILGDIDNDIGKVYYYAGGIAPTINSGVGAPTDVYNHLKWLDAKAYFITGISALAAGSEKPAGLNSGKALREYSDIETERFSIVSQNYEKSHIDAAKIIVDLAATHYKDGRKVTVQDKNFIEKVDWKEIAMADDEYVMQCWPASQLPDTPAGRFDTIIEFLNAGFIDLNTAKSLMDMPDIESAYSLSEASTTTIEKDLYTIAYKGEYRAPDKNIDLMNAQKLAANFYMMCRNENASDETLDMLSRYQDDVARLISIAKEEAAPPAPAIPATPTTEALPGEMPQDIPPLDPQAIPPL